MINSVEDLENCDDFVIKMILRKLTVDEIAIAMHGISPLLASKIMKSLHFIKKLCVYLSPTKRTAVRLSIVEETHKKIVTIANGLESKD